MRKNRATYFILGLAITGIALYYLLRDKVSKVGRQVVFQANREAEKFETFTENSPEVGAIINQYWCDGVGVCNFSDNQVISEGFNEEYPWSAAFVSWVMKASGAENFPANASHSNYIIETTINREADPKADFTAWDISEQKPQPADIVCRKRGGSIGDNTIEYGNVPSGTPLHCDIVTRVDENSIEAVGGNLSNKVKKVTISLDEEGYVNEPNYFVIIKNRA